MAKGPPDKPKNKKISEAKRQNANVLIASRLRGYYDSIIDEGTPQHLLTLLEQLHEAETNSKDK